MLKLKKNNSGTKRLTSALDRVGGQRHAQAALPPGKTRYPLYWRLVGIPGNLVPHLDSIPGSSIPSELLYRLSYPAQDRVIGSSFIYTDFCCMNPFRYDFSGNLFSLYQFLSQIYTVAQTERIFSNNCNFFYVQYKKIMLTPKQPVINAVLITYIDYSITENYIGKMASFLPYTRP